MAEIVGLISAVITLNTGTAKGISLARAIYKAQEEFDTLQEQLEHFTQFLDALRGVLDRHAGVPSPLLLSSLQRAKETVQRLDLVIREKVVKDVGGTKKAHRAAWIKNKPRLLELKAALRESQSDVLAAMSVDNLQVSLSAAVNVEDSKAASFNIDRRLYSMQQTLNDTYRAVLSLSISTHHKDLAETPQELRLLHQGSNYGLLESAREWAAQPDSAHDLQSGKSMQSEEQKVLDMLRDFSNMITLRKTSPKGSFEASPIFLPESYTTANLLPPDFLIVTSSYELSQTERSCVNCYRLFHRRSSRYWRRLSITIDIRPSSIYWKATKLAPSDINVRDAAPVNASSLPNSLLSQLQTYLAKMEKFDNDAQFRFTLADRRVVRQSLDMQITQQHPVHGIGYSSNVLISLDDLGCPRILEHEVVQIMQIESPSRFASCIKGILACETKFSRLVPSTQYLYNIRMLQCMKDDPNFATLIGIVVDDTLTRLKSYLIKFPQVKWRHLAQEITVGQYVPWERRERWARQLVDAVARAHSMNLVIGTLYYSRPPVLLNETDDVLLWRFENKFILGYTAGRRYPPEFHHLSQQPPFTAEEACPEVTAKTDIFHLGQILWYIAEYFPSGSFSPACMRAGCESRPTIPCDDSHKNPTALPRLSNHVPRYYQDIVDACRGESPHERPAAWRLASLFPPLKATEQRICEPMETGKPDLSSFHSFFTPNLACDYCRKDIGEYQGSVVHETFFHCNNCVSGDFDICQECYTKGIHCLEPDHFLVEIELSSERGISAPGRYHTSINESGTRDITEL
ncbi:MAG: hypothetical protein M1820_007073 [Bogoriella megaspora]|nr:MAG: hypothetical protein M1820_007073 [Bogoriella megaspora]